MTVVAEPPIGPATFQEQQRIVEEATVELRRQQKVNLPAGMDPHERMRLRAAATRARQLFPPPSAIGELLSREILIWEEFGYRLDNSRLILRLVDELLKTPLTPKPPPEPTVVHRIEVEK